MTDMDAACVMKELAGYNLEGKMSTPQMSRFDTIFQCAFDHAIRALEERAGATDPVYMKNPNGTYSVTVPERKEAEDA